MGRRLYYLIFLMCLTSCSSTNTNSESNLSSISINFGFKWQKLISEDGKFELYFIGGENRLGTCYSNGNGDRYRGLVYFPSSIFHLHFDECNDFYFKTEKVKNASLKVKDLNSEYETTFFCYDIQEQDIVAEDIISTSFSVVDLDSHILLIYPDESDKNRIIYYCAYENSVTFLKFYDENSFTFERNGIYSNGYLTANLSYVDLHFTDENIFKDINLMRLFYLRAPFSLIDEIRPSEDNKV